MKNGASLPKRDAADGAVDSWIEALLSTQSPDLAPARDHLRYTIEVREHYYVPRFQLAAFVVPVYKAGTHGAPRAQDLRTLGQAGAKHVLPADRTIGRLIAASGLLGGLGNLSPTVLGTLLEVMIRTGRLHWSSLHAPALQFEPVREARIAWRMDEDARQRPHVDGRPSTVLINASPLWYADPESDTAGPVDAAIPAEIATAIAAAPALTEEQARRAHVALRHLFTPAGVEGPQVAVDQHVIDRDPVPVVHLSASDGGPVFELRFAYGEHLVRAADEVREFRSADGETVSTWPRRGAYEKQIVSRLRDWGFIAVDWTNSRFTAEEEVRWIRFAGSFAPQLRARGWRIDIDARFPFSIVEPEPEWHADLTETERRWFELDLGIDVEGERLPLLPIVLDALEVNGIGLGDDLSALAERTDPIFGRLPSGKYVALPAARVARVLATLADLFDANGNVPEDGRVRVGQLQAAALANLEGAVNLHWSKARALKDLAAALTGISGSSLQLPDSFKATLRPYQSDGVAWLQALREHDFGGVLADDMGLGKTVQLLAHVAIEKAEGRLSAPVLIVAPTSVVPNWRAEIARFVPELRAVSLTGADRAALFAQIGNADVALTTYALLPRDSEYLLERDWSIAVLDEAQAIKNPRAKAAAVARELRAGQRIAMTGTPIENHLEELWSIYAFAVPGLLGERSRFGRSFRAPIEKRGDALRHSALAARLRPFLLRRTKDRVASELPELTEIVQRIELPGAQRDLYETIRLAMHRRVREEVQRRGLARSRIVVLDALLKLRQVCCDPRLVKLPAAAGVNESQKLEALLDMLENLIEDGRRILLFSQFTSMLDLIKAELVQRDMPFLELRGDTRDRETPVARFQRGEVPLFLISLKAGGTGLNLTAADTVIHYDPWWNPAVERQATDRAHRIGQEQHVFVYKLIAEGTVEERILDLQERKGALAANLFAEASAAPLRLDHLDIERLFT